MVRYKILCLKLCLSFSSMPRGWFTTNLSLRGKSAFYIEVLRRLKRRVNQVRPVIIGNWKLHHGNAPSYTCFKVTDYLTENGVTKIPQTPHSSDLFPADSFLFPKVKSSLKIPHYETLCAIKETCKCTLKDLSESTY